MKDGRRWSFADGYLKDALKRKIQAESRPGEPGANSYVAVLHGVVVKSGSRVTKIIWDKDKPTVARGVEYMYQGEKHEVLLNTNGELLLSAGAINSPQVCTKAASC